MNKFTIEKRSGTYSELLETYGFTNLLRKIYDSANISDAEIVIEDKEMYYEITTNTPITDEMIGKLSFFPLFRYVKQKIDADVSLYPDFFDYPTQREWKKERQTLLNQAYKEYKGKEKESERDRRIAEIKNIFETDKRIDIALDIYAQTITPNNFPGFDKLYQNIFNNKDLFSLFISEIIHTYGERGYVNKGFEKIVKNITFSKNVTATQLYNPNQGQGVNKLKADGLNRKNFDSSWICESLKISGALTDMICQPVKSGSSYDLKIFVPEYKQVKYHFKSNLIPDFKKYLKGNTPIQIDILNILLLTQKVIENQGFTGVRMKVKNIVSGLHSVYQKDLGQNKAVVNIGFIQVPDFIEIGNKEENQAWIDIIENQRQIIRGIKELEGASQGLLYYRNFISGSDVSNFFKFSYWYAAYISTQLSNKKYVRLFSIESLNQFYKCMDTNELKLSEITSSIGFQAIAYAIRKSTVTLLLTPKEARQYEPRYGVAQALQSKSKSSTDLAEYIGDFISFYNSETAMKSDKEKPGKVTDASSQEQKNMKSRRYVRENELSDFYSLLDKYPSKLVGALLASYGFALSAKENKSVENLSDDNTEENTED